MEKKLAQYANGFSLLVNKASNETILIFSQNQPKFDSNTEEFIMEAPTEVATIIIPYSLGQALVEKLQEAINTQEGTL